MKQFILGFISALIIGAWVCLAVTGIISIKTAIFVPAGIVVGFLLAIALISFFWDK